MELDISKIVQSRLSKDQYIDELTDKKQIYLHHTAGGPDAVAVAKYFNNKVGKVATAFIIGARGTIVQCFSSKNWAYHLGLKQEVFTEAGVSYKSLDKISVGIEICNYGPLTKRNGYYYNYVGGKVDYTEVTILDKKYKGSYLLAEVYRCSNREH
jgi:N-acetyl-anhydromuramyl-L-alanine amidase AmpD